MKYKEEKYLASIPVVSLTQLEQNIIVGSILSDGNLTYAPRSRNAYYREHFSLKQKKYREWKMNSIHSMKFRIEKESHLKSPSHSIYTELYNKFYINGVKTITEDNIKLLNHPIGLACLYMDDETLMISASKSKSAIRIHPTIGISTLSFSKEECEILSKHILKVFNIDFKLCSFPQGKGWNIRLSRLKEIESFFSLINPYCIEVSCLRYKWDLAYSLNNKKQDLIKKWGGVYDINIAAIDKIPNYYSKEEEEIICNMKINNNTYNEISKTIGRSYDSVSYKISQLKKQGKI